MLDSSRMHVPRWHVSQGFPCRLLLCSYKSHHSGTRVDCNSVLLLLKPSILWQLQVILRSSCRACQVPRNRNSPLAGQHHKEVLVSGENKGAHRQICCTRLLLNITGDDHPAIWLNSVTVSSSLLSQLQHLQLCDSRRKNLSLVGNAIRFVAWYIGWRLMRWFVLHYCKGHWISARPACNRKQCLENLI